MPTSQEFHDRYAKDAQTTIKTFNEQQKKVFLVPLFGDIANKMPLDSVSITYNPGKSLFIIKAGKSRFLLGQRKQQINGEQLSRLLKEAQALAVTVQNKATDSIYGQLPKRKIPQEEATQEYGPVSAQENIPLSTISASSSSTTPIVYETLPFNPATTTSSVNRENYNAVLRDKSGKMVDVSKDDNRKSPVVNSVATPLPKIKPVAGSTRESNYGSMPSQPNDKKNKPTTK